MTNRRKPAAVTRVRLGLDHWSLSRVDRLALGFGVDRKEVLARIFEAGLPHLEGLLLARTKVEAERLALEEARRERFNRLEKRYQDLIEGGPF